MSHPLSIRHKTAMIRDAEQASNAIITIINTLASYSAPENESGFRNTVRAKLYGMNPIEIASKNIAGDARIGQCLTLVKNCLSGQDQSFVSDVISKVIAKL